MSKNLPKDFIFRKHPNIAVSSTSKVKEFNHRELQFCEMANGISKRYDNLCEGDQVLIKSGEKYVVGKIETKRFITALNTNEYFVHTPSEKWKKWRTKREFKLS